MPETTLPPGQWFETDVPARLDRLPWSRWHTLVVSALGITWILDGLEVTLVGALGGIMQRKDTLGLSNTEVGLSATCYLAGAVLGALVFGYGTDRLGRKKLFYLTLIVYTVATAATALSWNFASYCVFRALTGAGIGGEYAAINSAIDELIPARVRGRVDLMVNGSYWFGAILGAVGVTILFDHELVAPTLGWRLAFGIGAVLGLGVLFIRHWVPESPRWLMTHGRKEEAERIVGDVERHVAETQPHHGQPLPPPEGGPSHVQVRTHTPWSEIWHAVAHEHRSRSVLGLTLMIAQAFFYNALFFTYALVLTHFYGVPAETTGRYLIPFALGNLFGPILLGHFFDTVGRRRMIAGTYAVSGVLLAITGWMFAHGMLTATTQAAAWTIIFFVASAAASAAYLTVSEIFPLEIRALAIAGFYAVGTLVGGVSAPWLFSKLIEAGDEAGGSRTPLAWGYAGGAVLMLVAAAVEARLGVDAEQKSLESIATPLASKGKAEGGRRNE